MNSKIYAGGIGRLPVYGSVTDLNSADVTAVISATTGLVKTLGKYALVGGLGALGLGAIFLAILLGSVQQSERPTIPLGCTPNYIKTRKRAFWGIVLDDELEIEVEGNKVKMPFDFVQSFRVGIESIWSIHDMEVGLVDGSAYKQVRLVAPTQLQVATLGGVQSIPFKLRPRSDRDSPCYRDDVTFYSPTVHEVGQLRKKLQSALDQNAAAITQVIGQNVLQPFFNISSI